MSFSYTIYKNDDFPPPAGGGRGEAITRHNYEEFFLLYVDNELSVNERKTVEEFVEQNPDLEEELVMLQQSVVRPEKNIAFDNKNLLLKNVSANGLVNETNYEEYFVLYGDNELTNNEKELVEQFVYKHPQYEEEFELIQQVKLMPDKTIVFPDKQSLYRSEEDDKVVPFPWRKMAAAAIIILFMGAFLWYVVNDNTAVAPNGPDTEIVQNDTGNNKKENKAIDENKGLAGNEKAENKITSEVNKQAGQKAMAATTPGIKKAPATPGNKEELIEVYAVNTIPEKNNDLPGNKITAPNVSPVYNPVVKDKKEPVIKQVEATIIDITPKPEITVAAINVQDPREKLNIPETQIIYVDEQQADDVTYVANTTVNKNPLRGLFRKVSRVFEKATNADDEDRNKKGIRIANFEIALK